MTCSKMGKILLEPSCTLFGLILAALTFASGLSLTDLIVSDEETVHKLVFVLYILLLESFLLMILSYIDAFVQTLDKSIFHIFCIIILITFTCLFIIFGQNA